MTHTSTSARGEGTGQFVAAPSRASVTVVAPRTGGLLACGVVAGTLFISLNVFQILFRQGFDMTRHALSLLLLGDLGWIQVANFVLTGLLAVAGAVGMRRVLHPGRAGTWGPLLIGVYGAGLIAAGIFPPDAGLGFPPGASAEMADMSWHGAVHVVAFFTLVISLVAACFVLARRFAAQRQRGWAAYSAITGLAAPALIVIGMANPVNNGVPLAAVGFMTAAWVAAVALRLAIEERQS